jgi:hypothetical protein
LDYSNNSEDNHELTNAKNPAIDDNDNDNDNEVMEEI